MTGLFRKVSVAVLGALFLATPIHPGQATEYQDWRNGDLIFQNSGGAQTEAILKATGSEFTHVGIVKLLSLFLVKTFVFRRMRLQPFFSQ